ncbi:hypothetical protein HID58_037912 [Brassica napus]|uniref:Uncharacterized protein n=1 Tax=Brassica napus TaxID=3708 RepID=A0ABQ8BPA5_BRANA|nr:hypothetical protein HID58_037912 [Brassica napus]
MAPSRVPSVGLVSGRQLDVFSDDEPRGCAQCREGLIGFSSDLWIFCPGVMDDPASRCVPLLLKGQGVVGDLGFLGLEDWSPEWSFTGKMRYLILLLGTPYLAGVFGMPRYLTTYRDDTCGPSPLPSWGMTLLWAEPAGSYEFITDPRP